MSRLDIKVFFRWFFCQENLSRLACKKHFLGNLTRSFVFFFLYFSLSQSLEYYYTETFRPFTRYQGSWFKVCKLFSIQLDDSCQKNRITSPSNPLKTSIHFSEAQLSTTCRGKSCQKGINRLLIWNSAPFSSQKYYLHQPNQPVA